MALNERKKFPRKCKKKVPDEVIQTEKSRLVGILEKTFNSKIEDEVEIMDFDNFAALSGAYDFLCKGKHFMDKGMYDEAISNLKDSIKLKPDISYTHFALGEAYLWKGRGNEAIEEFKELVRLAPLNLGGYYLLGTTFMSQLKYEEAALNFREATRLYDKFKRGELKAKDTFTSMLVRNGLIYKYSDIFGNCAEGFLFLSKGDFEESEKRFAYSNNLIYTNKFTELYYLLLFIEISKIDERTKNLRNSINFVELKNSVKELIIELGIIMQTADKIGRGLILNKLPYFIFLVDCLDPGVKQNLRSAFIDHGLSEEVIKEIEQSLFDLKYASKVFDKMRLSNAQILIKYLEAFILKVKQYPSPEDIPIEEQRLLIVSLIPFFETGGQVSLYFMQEAIKESLSQLEGKLLELHCENVEYFKEIKNRLNSEKSPWSFLKEIGIPFSIDSIGRFFKGYGECILILWKRTNYVWASLHASILVIVSVKIIRVLIPLLQKLATKISLLNNYLPN